MIAEIVLNPDLLANYHSIVPAVVLALGGSLATGVGAGAGGGIISKLFGKKEKGVQGLTVAQVAQVAQSNTWQAIKSKVYLIGAIFIGVVVLLIYKLKSKKK